MQVILDLHNYGRRKINGTEYIIGSASLPVEHVTDVWGKLAAAFKDKTNIWGYGIMNEPHDMLPAAPWFSIAQAVIDKIRTIDHSTNILVGGDSWSSAERWPSVSNNLKDLVDPDNKLIFEAHVYFDKNASGAYSGTYDSENASPNTGVVRVEPFVAWLQQHNLKGFIGEYGVPGNDARWLNVLDNFLSYLQSNCINGTYWAAGPWWGSYSLSVEPEGNTDKPQMEVLKNYTSTGNSCNTAGMLPDNSSTVHLKSNPVQDVLNLELSSFFTDIVIEIIDSRGGFVNRYIKSGQTINIDVKSLPAGIYILSISTNDRSERLRMVKN